MILFIERSEDIDDLLVHEAVLLSAQKRQAISDLCKLFEGHVVDIGSEHMILELSSWSRRVNAFLKMLKPFGIIEATRTGNCECK